MPAELICPADAKIELSDDGTTWVDITTYAGRIDPGARERPLITYKTFGGSLSCTGTADPTDIELEFVYTEGDDEPYAMVRAAHYADTPLSVRWQVKVATGTKRWQADDCRVPTFDEPEVNADGEGIITLATLSAETIVWEAVTP